MYWIQMTGRGEAHADHAQYHSAHCALEGDRPHPLTDVHEFVDLLKRVIHDDYARGFRGHVTTMALR